MIPSDAGLSHWQESSPNAYVFTADPEQAPEMEKQTRAAAAAGKLSMANLHTARHALIGHAKALLRTKHPHQLRPGEQTSLDQDNVPTEPVVANTGPTGGEHERED